MAPHAELLGTTRVEDEDDLVLVRAMVRDHCARGGLDLVDETKILTAASELARNIIRYARPAGGEVRVELISDGSRKGLRATFEDRGPGIPDVDRALQDGYSTGGSLGLGLPGARRLVDEFSIESGAGRGTRVVLVKWAG